MAPVPYETWKFRVAWQSHPDDPAPIWTDETARVDGAISITEGRSDYNSTIQTSQLQAALRNHDQRYTPGNRTSPLWPHVKPAKRCQVTDLVGNEEVSIFDGFIELPEITTWQKSDTAAPREQTFALSAVDRMGRLDRARPFASTLGAHILGQRNPTLVAYWSLVEDDRPAVDQLSAWPLKEVKLTSSLTATEGVAGIGYGQGTGPRADDGAAALFTASTDGSSTVQSLSLVATRNETVLWNLAAGQTITAVVWVHMDWTRDETVLALSILTDDGLVVVTRQATDSGLTEGQWRTSKPIGDLTGNTSSGAQAASLMAYPVAVQFGYDPNTLELWVEDEAFTATLSGTLSPTPLPIRNVTVGALEGSLSHLQVYVGDPAAFTIADLAAQVEAGRHGLANQRVDERIETIAGYAGISADDLHLDRASAIMPIARLAGRRPGDVLRDAAAADNGLILAHGDGHLTFLGRGRRYNPPLAATVQLTWLEEVAWRTDPPTNVADVSTTEGFEGHAVDTASVEEFGEYAPSLPQLDTAVDVDAANLAAHTVRYGNQPRQRPSRLVFQLRGGTSDEIRGAVLRREIGDRVHLDGLPANAPEGADQFHLEGMVHQISSFGHRVTWYTGPVVGSIPGTPDPLPKVGAAKVRHNTTITY